MSDLKCPVCGHTKFHCKGRILSSNLVASFDDGELDYQLLEWDEVEEAYYYDCQNCNFSFEGDEDEFLRFLAQRSFTIITEG